MQHSPPPNIQKAIDRWKKENCESKPPIVNLEKYKDFDGIKHMNSIIRFPPGGKVGDKMWKLQFMHNNNVTYSYNRTKNPVWAPETYLVIKEEEMLILKEIKVVKNNVLLNEIHVTILCINIYDLTPLTYHKFRFLYNENEMYFLKPCGNVDPSCFDLVFVYNDGSTKIMNDRIHVLKY